MVAILTSSLGGSYKADGKRYPSYLLRENGLTERIKEYWKDNSNVLVLSASPSEHERNDSILSCQREAFLMTGLSVNSFEMCDDRNEGIIQRIDEFDVLLLTGGHVPTQNAFFKRLDLRKQLNRFKGIVISWSAGSMNCAQTVYAMPELEGEVTDPHYQRFIPGLGITKCMIIPHYQDIKTDMIDGLRMIEDVAYPDSMGKEFIALNDGSYIVSNHGVDTVYGEAYLIKDGQQTQICGMNGSLQLSR